MSFNFEGQSRRLDRGIFIREVYPQAKKFIESRTPSPDSFADLYSSEVVAKDNAKVASREEAFKQKSPETTEAIKWATLFEAVFLAQTEESGWFGDATVTKTSRFDDIFNGIDFIAEFEEESMAAHLGLVIDVTLARDLSGKIDTIAKELQAGILTKVKYFRSDKINIKDELPPIPRVVVTAEAKTIEELAQLWLNAKSPKKEISTEAREKLRTHFFQFQVLAEIKKQLIIFRDHAVDKSVQAIYARALTLVGKILEEKKKADPKMEDEGERDQSWDELLVALSALENRLPKKN